MIFLIFVRILFLILVLILLYTLFDVFREIKLRGYIGNIFGKFSSQYEERRKNREVYILLEGEREDTTFIEKLDLLIERSGLKSYVPFISAEILGIFSVVSSFIVAMFFQKLAGLMIFSVAVFFITILFIYLSLKQLAKFTYDRIDDQLLVYINTLENLTTTNSDIVEIMEKALPYMKEPLKTFSRQFVFECKKGVSKENAFKHFENKIESRRFKQLIKNLEVCSKYEANYKEILNKSRIIMKNYFSEKARRTKEVRQGRLAIISVIIVGIILFQMVAQFDEDLVFQLKNTFIGNIIIGYNLFVILFAIFKFITLDKINY